MVLNRVVVQIEVLPVFNVWRVIEREGAFPEPRYNVRSEVERIQLVESDSAPEPSNSLDSVNQFRFAESSVNGPLASLLFTANDPSRNDP